jgi:hypothetical protein
MHLDGGANDLFAELVCVLKERMHKLGNWSEGNEVAFPWFNSSFSLFSSVQNLFHVARTRG